MANAFFIMSKISSWLSAFRFRTLFLAVAGVTLGSGLALHSGSFYSITLVLALLLALSIQILSNLSNDLGDYIKGTDITGNREGPKRAVQSGTISPKEMKIGIIINTIIVIALGLSLIFYSIDIQNSTSIYILLAIGLTSILAALFYTLGRYAYGYVGWGDFFAFLFFGPIAVVGTYFLHTNSLDLRPFLPAIGLGIISTMILNVNNMRDIKNDKASGKTTVASNMGLRNAKIYHTILTIMVFASFSAYSVIYAPHPWYRLIYIIVYALQLKTLTQIWKKEDRELDPFLKDTSIAGFLLSVIFSICINI